MFWQKKIFVLLGLIFCICLVVSGLLRGQSKSLAVSQPPKKVVTLSLVGHFDGMIQSVAITNTTAYLGDDHSLVMLDVSDPSSLVEIIRASDIVTDTIFAIDISNSYIYLAAGNAGLAIIEYLPPDSPKIIGQLYGNTSTEIADNLIVIDAAVFLSIVDYGSYEGRIGKSVVDITSLSNPRELSFYQSGRYGYKSSLLTVMNSYVISSPEGLDIIDFSNPISPTLITNIDTGFGYPEDAVIIENILYSVQRPYIGYQGIVLDGGLYVNDISDVTNPQRLVGYFRDANFGMIDSVDNYIFYYGVEPRNTISPVSIDVLEVGEPWTWIGNHFLPDNPVCYDMKIDGHYIYLACGEQGLFIYRWDVVELTEIFFLPVIINQPEGD